MAYKRCLAVCSSTVALLLLLAACGSEVAHGGKVATRGRSDSATTTPTVSSHLETENTAPSQGGYTEGSISYDAPLLDGQQVESATAAQALVKYALSLPADVTPSGVFVRAGSDDPATAAVVFTSTADTAHRFVILEVPATMDEKALEQRQYMGDLPGSEVKASLETTADGKHVVTFSGNATAGVDFLLGSVEVRVYGAVGEFTADDGLSLAAKTWSAVPAG